MSVDPSAPTRGYSLIEDETSSTRASKKTKLTKPPKDERSIKSSMSQKSQKSNRRSWFSPLKRRRTIPLGNREHHHNSDYVSEEDPTTLLTQPLLQPSEPAPLPVPPPPQQRPGRPGRRFHLWAQYADPANYDPRSAAYRYGSWTGQEIPQTPFTFRSYLPTVKEVDEEGLALLEELDKMIVDDDNGDEEEDEGEMEVDEAEWPLPPLRLGTGWPPAACEDKVEREPHTIEAKFSSPTINKTTNTITPTKRKDSAGAEHSAAITIPNFSYPTYLSHDFLSHPFKFLRERGLSMHGQSDTRKRRVKRLVEEMTPLWEGVEEIEGDDGTKYVDEAETMQEWYDAYEHQC